MLYLRHWPSAADGAPRATLLCVHGVSEHSGRYDRLATVLTAAGIDVLAADLYGHGRSPGRRGHIRSFAGDHLRAVDTLLAAAGERGTAQPTFLLGHSLGGLVAARWVQTRPIDRPIAGLLLMAPFVAPALRVPGWKRLLARLVGGVLPGVSLATGIRDEDLFRDDLARSSFACDPLVQRRMSAGHWLSIVRECRHLLEEAGAVRCPVLLQLAGEDRIVSNDAARRLAAALPESRTIEYDGALHALHADPAGTRVFRDMIAWMLETAA